MIDKSKRKLIEDMILKYIKMLDPTNTNYDNYVSMFANMSDKEFDQYMQDIENKKTNIYMLFPNMKIPMKMENILPVAEKLGVKLTERITQIDSVSGKKYTTPHEYLVIRVPIRRARQFLKGKIAVSDSDKRIDSLTGQVVKPDRASALSYVEVELLFSKNLNATIHEFFRVRGGDITAYAQFKQQLEETGQASLNSLSPDTTTQSSKTVAAMLYSLLFDHNLLE